jgi:hypothetical protein
MQVDSDLGSKAEGMGAVLRVRGDDFDVDDLLRKISLSVCHVERKGQPRFSPRSRIADCTGFNASTSEASERDLPKQVEDTIKYLRLNESDLKNVMSFPGVTDAEIDFAVECRLNSTDIFAQNDYLPPELLALAGNLGIGINLTLYPASTSEGEQ